MNTYPISEAIGYDVEVSEPNGPAVHGYITARWAHFRQKVFDRFIARVQADTLRAAADQYDALQTKHNDHYSRRDPALWLRDWADLL